MSPTQLEFNRFDESMYFRDSVLEPRNVVLLYGLETVIQKVKKLDVAQECVVVEWRGATAEIQITEMTWGQRDDPGPNPLRSKTSSIPRICKRAIPPLLGGGKEMIS